MDHPNQPNQNKIRAANIRAVWEALLAPKWDKDVLINLGKALYARRPLKDLDAGLFNELLPRLVEVVERLEAKFTPTPNEVSVSPTTYTPEATGAAGPDPTKLILKTKEKPNVSPPSDTLLPDVSSTQRK
jgi:hypothetical protein